MAFFERMLDMKNLKNINHSHCEPQAWQSHKANTIFEKESETPLTAVGTLTALLCNSTKVVENFLTKQHTLKWLELYNFEENML